MKRPEEVVLRVVEGAEAGEGGEICSGEKNAATVHVERRRVESVVLGDERGEDGQTCGGRNDEASPVSSSVSTFGNE